MNRRQLIASAIAATVTPTASAKRLTVGQGGERVPVDRIWLARATPLTATVGHVELRPAN